MIKKLTIAAVVLPLCMAAQAREGAYIGANLSWSQIDTTSHGGVLPDRSEKKDDGFGGALYTGYGRMGANGFLALEVNAAMSDTEVNLKLGHEKSTLEMKDSYGAGFLMGANLPHNFAVYARAGWQQSEFKLGASVNQKKGSVRQEHDGIRYGVGVLIPLHERLDLRAEFTRTDYNKKTYLQGVKIEPETNEIMLGGAIRF